MKKAVPARAANANNPTDNSRNGELFRFRPRTDKFVAPFNPSDGGILPPNREIYRLWEG
jgi:hypothetical protein